MSRQVYAVGSVTNAMRGKEWLGRHGITAFVGRVPPDSRVGCGYTLTVTGDFERAETLLREAGIPVRAVK